MHIYAMDSVRELHTALNSSRGFRRACRMLELQREMRHGDILQLTLGAFED